MTITNGVEGGSAAANKSGLRVLVCGGRNYGYVPRGEIKWSPSYNRACAKANDQRATLEVTLNRLDVAIIIHGASHGADELAGQWARRHAISEFRYLANWYPNGRRGGLDKSAGPKRNQRMLDEGRPDLVIAFPGGRGTADMVARARAAGIEVREIT